MNPLVILDFNRTLFDPVGSRPIRGAASLLRWLKARGIATAIVSRREVGRDALIRSSGLGLLVNEVVLVDTKTVEEFIALLTRFNADRSRSIIVGDRFVEEISIGLALGVSSIWITTAPERSREGVSVVSSLDEAASVLRASVR